MKSPTLEELRDQVLVITGASIGIGLASAESPAQEGAGLVLPARRFGRLDSWINTAGPTIYGRLDEVSEADRRRRLDVKLRSVDGGSRAALRQDDEPRSAPQRALDGLGDETGIIGRTFGTGGKD